MKIFTFHVSRFTFHVSLLLLLLLSPGAFADLSAVVQPGYVFGVNERPSTSTLNRLGQPTITITGTVGGTNAAVAVGSINGTHFSDTIVDGTNITFNTASPRALKIVDGGVSTTQISTNIAGNGLGGGGGTNLFINLDTNATPGISIAGDMLTITNVPPHRLNVTSNYVIVGVSNNVGQGVDLIAFAHMLRTNVGFISYEYTLSGQQVAHTNHSLGVTPGFLRWVIVCKTNDSAYVVGDEIDVDRVWSAINDRPEFSTGANSTNVWINSRDASILEVLDKGISGTPDYVELTAARWRAKCYARP